MKAIIFLLLITLSFSEVKGQSLAFNEPTIHQYEHYYINVHDSLIKLPKYHCKATRDGFHELIISRGCLAAGGALYLISTTPAINNYHNQSGLIFLIATASFIYSGAGYLVIGLVQLTVGTIRDHETYDRRFSLIGDKNQLGLAYNFR